jgi:hypothetical protein
VCQNTPVAARPRKNNRAGSTRILTDTPEKLKIEEDNRRKEEKERKKEERKMKKLAPRNILKPAAKKIERERLNAKASMEIPNENDMPSDFEEDLDHQISVQPTSPPNQTRAGRLVKKRKITLIDQLSLSLFLILCV